MTDRYPEDEVLLCRCQEVTAGEVRQAIGAGARTLRDLKVRCGCSMGLCQGRTCRTEIAALLARETGQDAAALLPRCSRPPLRPVPLGDLAGDRQC